VIPALGVVGGAELVVIQDRRFRDTQRRQQQRRAHAGTVLARGAVKQRGQAAGLGEPGQQPAEGRGRGLREGLVHPHQEVVRHRGQLPGDDEVSNLPGLPGGTADREQLTTDVGGQCRRGAAAFGVAAQVVDDAEPEPADRGEVGHGQPVRRVRPEDQAPAGPPAPGGTVAAEVAEVGGALKCQQTLGRHDRAAAAGRRDGHVVASRAEAGQRHLRGAVDRGDRMAVVDRPGRRPDGNLDRPVSRQLPGDVEAALPVAGHLRVHHYRRHRPTPGE